MNRLIMGLIALVMLLGRIPIQKESTEVLDLNMVEKYEFNVILLDDFSETAIHIEDAEDVREMNAFLGQAVVINHSGDSCDCVYLDSVRIYLLDGRELFFGIERNEVDSFNFSNYSLSVIRFEDKSYDELMNFVKTLGEVSSGQSE